MHCFPHRRSFRLRSGELRMSLLRGVQRLAAARRIILLPSSCLAALRSRFSSAHLTAEGAADQTSPDPCAQTRPRPASPRVRGLPRPPMCGGIHDAPGREKHPDAIDLARFAVAEHNSNTNAALEFVRLVKVRTQLVAGRMYYFTVEVREVDGGANKLYEAKVWLRSWENFKGLRAFEPIADAA